MFAVYLLHIPIAWPGRARPTRNLNVKGISSMHVEPRQIVLKHCMSSWGILSLSRSLALSLPASLCVCVCVFAGLSLCVSVFLAVCLPVALCVSVPSRHSTRRNRMPSKFSSGNKGSHCITRLWALLLLESRSKAHICQRLCLLKPLLREHFRAYCSRQTSYNYCIKTQYESLTEWYRLQGPWKLQHLVGTEEARELRKDGAGGAYHPVRDVRGFRGRHRRDLPPCVRLGLGFTAV